VTDIETECNGLITYDREIVKLPSARIASAIRGGTRGGESVVVVPCAEQGLISWRYSFNKPAGDWTKPAFDDTQWPEGIAGFGTVDTPNTTVRTEWKTSDIWVRRQFNLDKTSFDSLKLHVYHDEDVEVFLNGIPAFSDVGYVSGYLDVEIQPEAIKALKPGENTIAIHCHQTIGGQYIDAGFVSTRPSSPSRP
jgi:hypothetical protein